MLLLGAFWKIAQLKYLTANSHSACELRAARSLVGVRISKFPHYGSEQGGYQPS